MRDSTGLLPRRGHPLGWLLAGILASAPAAQAATYHAFGPQRIDHPRGQPTTETFAFEVAAPGGGFLLRVADDGGGRPGGVSSVRVWLNGALVVRPSDFAPPGPRVIEKPVGLGDGNALTVQLTGRPGGLTIEILGEDDDPPAITAKVSPPPNAAGWHNRAHVDAGGVTVSFECSDATSGIAGCSAPVVLAAEGAGQVVAGEAVDRAGNKSRAQVVVSIDATPPAIEVLAPTDGMTVPGFGFIAEGVVSDALSGVGAAAFDGAPLDLDAAGGFRREVDLPDAGIHAFEVSALDVAGNPAAESFKVIQDKTEHLEIEVVLPAAGEASPLERPGGWPLALRLIGRDALGLANGTVFLPAPDPFGEPNFLVFDLGPDPELCLPSCAPGEVDEVFLEFTLDTDHAGVPDAQGNAAVRALTASGEAGVPEILAVLPAGVNDPGPPALVAYGPATGGAVVDGYGYGPNDDLPGLVVLSDTGPGVVFDPHFDLVVPREARNLAGFFETVSYEVSDASLRTSVVTSMSVPLHLFSPLLLADLCLGAAGPDCPPPDCPDTGWARVDGGAIVEFGDLAFYQALNARQVTLRIFAVNGVAPSSLVDSNLDGRVDFRDARAAGLDLLSRETVFRFRQVYDPLFVRGDSAAPDALFFDLDASGGVFRFDDSVNCDPGAGGIVSPPR